MIVGLHDLLYLSCMVDETMDQYFFVMVQRRNGQSPHLHFSIKQTDDGILVVIAEEYCRNRVLLLRQPTDSALQNELSERKEVDVHG